MAALAVAGGLFLMQRGKPYRDAAALLPKELELARAEGLPLKGQDLVRNVPAKDNAAMVLTPLLDEIQKSKTYATALRDAEAHLKANRYSGALASLKPYAALMPRIRDAVSRRDLEFQRDWSDPLKTLFPEFAPLKNLVKVLGYRATCLAHTGKLDQALDEATLAAGLTAKLKGDPTLIGMLVHIACESIVSRALEQVSSAAADNRGVQSRIASIVRGEYGPVPSMAEALRGEVIFAVAAPDSLDELGALVGPSADSDNARKPFPTIPGVSRKVQADAYRYRGLNFWRRAFRDFKGTDSAIEVSKILEKMVTEEEKREKEPTHELNAIILPVFSQAGKAVAKAQVTRTMLTARTALMQYRQRTGRFPATLAEAGLKPLDVFDGKALRYAPEGSGFKIWSVGVNGTDEGGIPRSSGNENDLVMFHPYRGR